MAAKIAYAKVVPLTDEEIEEAEDLRREQAHDNEYDYVDMHSRNIKQSGRDGALIKKTATISKEEQQKIQKEQYRLKQIKIQKKKEEQAQQQQQAQEQQAQQQQQAQQREWEQRLQMDKQMINENTKSANEVAQKNADDCDWEDLY
jgi:hypothetical protein